jgi:hypothetical protein
VRDHVSHLYRTPECNFQPKLLYTVSDILMSIVCVFIISCNDSELQDFFLLLVTLCGTSLQNTLTYIF